MIKLQNAVDCIIIIIIFIIIIVIIIIITLYSVEFHIAITIQYKTH